MVTGLLLKRPQMPDHDGHPSIRPPAPQRRAALARVHRPPLCPRPRRWHAAHPDLPAPLEQDYLFLVQFARADALAGYKKQRLADLRAASDGFAAILGELPASGRVRPTLWAARA